MSSSNAPRRYGKSHRPPPGVSIDAGHNVDAAGATIVGGDNVVNNKRNLRIGLGGLAVLLVAGGGTAVVYGTTSSGAADVVHTAGESGAKGTLLAMRDAELHGDATRWCYLASEKNTSTCRALMANSFSTSQSTSDRTEIPDIDVRSAGGSGNGYTFAMVKDGHSYPVPMAWTGRRWELSPGLVYTLAVNNGGIFLSVIETRKGQGSILGIPFGSHG
jgi:hypothetical protein